jgi:hypothetical protein
MFISAEWGLQKDGRVFVVKKRDGSHLTTLEKHVSDVEGGSPLELRYIREDNKVLGKKPALELHAVITVLQALSPSQTTDVYGQRASNC